MAHLGNPGCCCTGCCKQVWRSEYDCDALVWLTPTLFSDDSDQACGTDVDWHIPTGECYAEKTIYLEDATCPGSPTTPSTPTISAPAAECCPEPDLCDECCANVSPLTAQLDITANWGVFFIDRGFINPSIKCEPPCNPPNACTPATCNPCDDVTARSVIFDMTTLIPASCAAGYDPPCVPAGSHGASCNLSRMSWSDTYECCGYSSFGVAGSATSPVEWCADMYIAKHADDASCRLYLILRQVIRVNQVGFGSFTASRGSRVYASGLLSDDCCGEVTISSDTMRGMTALGCSTGDLCDTMPTSLTVTLVCE